MAKQTRYFKATDGKKTVFRGSATRVYQSATMDGSFSANAAKPGYYPAVEITKAEYEALVAEKTERMKAAGRNMKWSTPSDSWVWNKKVKPNMEVIVNTSSGESVVALGSFLSDNEFLPGEVKAIYAHLNAGRIYQGGGGAAAAFTVRLANLL